MHVEPVPFEQLAVDLLDRGAGEPITSDQLTKLTSLLNVDLAVVYGPVQGSAITVESDCVHRPGDAGGRELDRRPRDSEDGAHRAATVWVSTGQESAGS